MAPQAAVIQVSMVLDSLDRIPKYPPPAGFSLRMFRKGDEATWTDVWTRAEKFVKLTPETFGQEFGSDETELAARMAFLVGAAGQVVGTAAAWVPDKAHPAECGRIHWVALVPEMQGRGLSKPLLAAVLERMKAMGYRTSFLYTHSVRTAAIKLYLEFGFRPEVRSDKEREAWKEVRARLAPSVLDRVPL